jgi:hypothetical protein
MLMDETRNGAAPAAHDKPELTAALQRVMPFDTLNLDAAGFADWEIRLSGGEWKLGREGDLLCFGAAGARMRVIRDGVAHLMVGGNGHASILAAIKAARDGDTILIAPGRYREEQAFVSDRSVTLQGVTDHGQSGAPGSEADTLPQVRLFNEAGRLKRIYHDIQAALDAAAERDRILAPAGRHVGDLHISTDVTLSGMNAGRPGGSARRGIETTIMGRIVMGQNARSIVLDGLVVWGSFAMEPAAQTDRRFALRNCVIDGRDADAAISLARGAASEIVNNLILGGNEAAIGIRCGFDDLSICGNRIDAAAGAVGIALAGGPGTDRIEILGNTFMDGFYGVFVHGGELGQQGDAVLLSGNHFGENSGGTKGGAPRIAAVHADAPLPAWLEFSLGLSLELNNYHITPPALGVDVMFELPQGNPVVRSLTRFAASRRESRRNR